MLTVGTLYLWPFIDPRNFPRIGVSGGTYSTVLSGNVLGNYLPRKQSPFLYKQRLDLILAWKSPAITDGHQQTVFQHKIRNLITVISTRPHSAQRVGSALTFAFYLRIYDFITFFHHLIFTLTYPWLPLPPFWPPQFLSLSLLHNSNSLLKIVVKL